MGKKKMIITDLDGTLLRNDKTISAFTAQTIDELRRRGNIFVIATARPIRTVQSFMNGIIWDAGVYHNGAVINVGNKMLHAFAIKNPVEVIHELSKYNSDLRISMESEDKLYANFDADKLWPGNGFIFCENFEKLKNRVAEKIIIEVSSMNEMDQYKEWLPDDLYIQMSENKIGMIMNKRATKYNSIKILSDYFGIDVEDCISFGDDYNDIEMIEKCGRGIAVENALSDVKDAADEICDTNEKDGVANWIKENLL